MSLAHSPSLPSSRQHRLAIAGLPVALGMGLLVLLSGFSGPAGSAPLEALPGSWALGSPPPAPVPLQPEAIARIPAATRLALQPVDLLTGRSLELTSLELFSGGTRTPFPSGTVRLPASWLRAGDAAWQYTVPGLSGPRPYRLPAAAAPPDAENRLRLPYLSGIHGRVLTAFNDRPLGGATVVAFLLDPERLQRLAADLGGPGQLPRAALDALTFRLELYRKAFGEVPRQETVTGPDGKFSLFIPAGKPVTLHVWHPDATPSTREVEARPGWDFEHDFYLDPRPVVTGVVRNAEGRPVPGIEVKVGVSMDHLAPGLSPYDNEDLGFALVQAARSSGELPESAAWRTVRTDGHGRYSLKVPQARRYAASVVWKNDYVFEDRESPGPYLPVTVINLDVGVRSKSAPPIRVRFSDGRPLDGAEVRIAVTSDFPWFRQFPVLHTDENGTLAIPWRDPDVQYALFFSHPGITAYALNLPPGEDEVTIPPERRVLRGR